MTTRLLVLALFATGSAVASDVPFYVAGGISMFSGDLRELTDKQGIVATIGWGDTVKSLIGAPSLDLTWAQVKGQGNRLDSVAVMYSERIPLAESVYLGAGVGSFWNQMQIQGNKEQNWSIGARGSAGLSLGGFSGFSPFVEATWFFPLDKTSGIKTDYIALVGGFWF